MKCWHELITAGMLIMAGSGHGTPLDHDELGRWTRVGMSGGMRSRKGERRGHLPYIRFALIAACRVDASRQNRPDAYPVQGSQRTVMVRVSRPCSVLRHFGLAQVNTNADAKAPPA